MAWAAYLSPVYKVMSMTTTVTGQVEYARTYTDFQGLSKLKAQASKDQSAALQETAQQFEAMFVQLMLKEMRKSIPKEGLFDSQAVQTFQDMADKQTAIDLAKRGEFGIAQLITQQLNQQGMAMPTDQIREMQELNKSFDIKNMVSGTGLAIDRVEGFGLPENRQTGYTLKQQKAAFGLTGQ
jgi:Rod binding domain-containing protein